MGRSPYLQGVHAVADASLIGQIAPVRIEGASKNSLSGVMAGQPQPAPALEPL